MPNFDKTGPEGKGPLTGRGLGYGKKDEGEKMEKYVKVPKSDIVEKTTKKMIHGEDKPATSEKIVNNILNG